MVVHKTMPLHKIHAQNHRRRASNAERPKNRQIYDSHLRVRHRNSSELQGTNGAYT